MDIKKIVPWNWFKDEEKSEAGSAPIVKSDMPAHPLMGLHQEIDRVFDSFWSRLGFPAADALRMPRSPFDDMILKPSLDIASTDQAYSITVEVPGVEEGDVQLELVEDRLVIAGEKSRESSTQEKDFYRSERSFGAFRRVLSLPDDADRDNIEASFEKGVLTIKIPRKAVPQRSGHLIDIKTAA